MLKFQKSFQNWLKADQKRMIWVLLFLVVCVFGMGLVFSWANNNTTTTFMADGSRDKMGSPFYFVGAFLKMVGVLLLLLGVAYFVHRWRGNTEAKTSNLRQMQKLETMQLSPKQALHLVRVGDKNYLLGATETSLNLIADVQLSQEVLEELTEKSSSRMKDFGSLLAMQVKKTDRMDAEPVSVNFPAD